MGDRRRFLKGMAGAGVMSAAAYRNVRGANERVQVGVIGVGLIGKRHLIDFLAQPDVEVAAVSEVYAPRLAEGLALAGGRAAGFKDFRRMLERRDLDAVVVSTPDHWHALQTILACAAGKDVYVEKPLTHSVDEGRWMIEAARKHKRVVQVGTQQRSGKQYQECRDLIRGGHLGELRNARVTAFRNISPGFSKPVGEEPLSAEEWELWLGPAPFVPFDKRRCIYHFRWFWDYSGGQTTNLLSHDLDIVQWVTGKTPTSVSAVGGRYSLAGIGETPDLCEAVLEYPGFVVNWSNREICGGARNGLEFCGTKGRLLIDRAKLEVVPDRQVPPDDQIPQFTAPRRVASDAPPRTPALARDGFEQVRDQFVPHVRNFLDCVKSREQPLSELESGHQTAASCHLVNIAMKLKRTVRWDAEKGQILGDPEAAKMLRREYRAPWDRELRAALPKG
ncbi:MAG TPA: Gfo/Idh/MocA family oxidoreductase [Blastocatellia bacterium]|nr:Gfo/Idh/MocA family oxidoreductase [Blastocatellia bacterium]